MFGTVREGADDKHATDEAAQARLQAVARERGLRFLAVAYLPKAGMEGRYLETGGSVDGPREIQTRVLPEGRLELHIEKYRGEILRRLDCRNQIEALEKARQLSLL